MAMEKLLSIVQVKTSVVRRGPTARSPSKNSSRAMSSPSGPATSSPGTA